jgi:vitamin B12 transporter
MRLRAVSPLLFSFAVTAAEHASPPLIVTADRQSGDTWRTTASSDVVTFDELQQRGQPLNLWQYPQGLPGVDGLATSGGLDGGLAGVRLRGSGAADTLVLLDGVPLIDAAESKSSPNLALFDGTGILAVEIVRGAQSGLYGSGAVGGVMGLRSARPTPQAQIQTALEGGSYGTARLQAIATGPLGDGWGYALTLGGLRSDGFSAQTERADGRGDDNEADGVARGAASARLEAAIAPALTIYASARGQLAHQDYDGYDPLTFGPAPDDDASQQRQRFWQLAGGGEARCGRATAQVDAARSYLRRSDQPSGDRYDGVSDFGTARLTHRFLQPQGGRSAWDKVEVIAGIDSTRNTAEVGTQRSAFHASDRLVGGYLQGLAGGDRWEASLVGRGDHHSREGGNGTWRAGATFFPIHVIRIHGSAASAFRAPSLFELYDPTYGNAELAAQRSRSYDLGIGSRSQEGWSAEVTAFRTDYTQDITYDPATFVSANSGGYRLSGIESGLTWDGEGEGFRCTASWTGQRTTATTSGMIPFLPRHKAMVQPGWDFGPFWSTVRVEATGRREGGGAALPGYALLGVAVGWQLSQVWKLSAHGDNLLNAAYQTFPGYSTAGTSGYAGVAASF